MADWAGFLGATMLWVKAAHIIFVIFLMAGLFMICLLYTSDAADE